MDKIASFTIDHNKLKKGLYVSRKDVFGLETLTTFDLRFSAPYADPPVPNAALHTIEHLAATFLRNGDYKDEIVYFGPMGCRTGCYLIMHGDLTSENVYNLVLDACNFIIKFTGEIPGAKKGECGNYAEHDLEGAKNTIKNYKNSLIIEKNLIYPD